MRAPPKVFELLWKSFWRRTHRGIVMQLMKQALYLQATKASCKSQIHLAFLFPFFLIASFFPMFFLTFQFSSFLPFIFFTFFLFWWNLISPVNWCQQEPQQKSTLINKQKQNEKAKKCLATKKDRKKDWQTERKKEREKERKKERKSKEWMKK